MFYVCPVFANTVNMQEINKVKLREALPDMLKGIAVIRMILVHIMAVFATPQLHDSTAGRLVVFIAGPPGAPLFMLIMGYFIAISGKSTAITVYRGFKLLVWGLLLNLGMNLHLLIKVINGSIEVNPWPYVFGVDILFLAGFSLIIMAGFRKLFQNSILAWVLLILFFTLAGNFIPVYNGDVSWIQYALAYLHGNSHWSYFPVFPWIAYPTSGYIFYLLVKKYGLNEFSRKGLIYAGSSLLVLVLVSFSWGFSINVDFYKYHHHSLMFFVWAIVLVACWVILIRLVTMNHENTLISKYLQWVGRHITNFYVFQWLLVGNIGTVLYKTQDGLAIAGWFFLIVLLSSSLVYLWRLVKKYSAFT